MLGFEGVSVVDVQGHSGGLAFLWKNKDEANLLSYSRNHIDLRVKPLGMREFRLTCLYGESDRTKRKETWSLIRNLATDNDFPWCVIGELNNMTSQDYKKGGPPYPNWLIQGFKEVLTDCDLRDMDLEGYQYTWERDKGTNKWVEIRLDRALANTRFFNEFPEAKLTNIEVSTSYHCPIFLEPVIGVRPVKTKKFKFENVWLKEPMCQQIVEDTWRTKQGLSLQEKIKYCSTVLSTWGQEITGSFKNRIKERKKIIRILKGRRDEESMRKYQEESKNLNEIYVQQEVFLETKI